MTVWWKYREAVEALGVQGASEVMFRKNLLRSLAAGRISSMADFVIYSGDGPLLREEFVSIPPDYWRERRTMFAPSKKLTFRPELNKLYNPSIRAPAGYDGDPNRQWGVDCFNVTFLREEVEKELLPASVNRGDDGVPSLPEGAKPQHYQYAPFAHEAAKLLREDPSLKRETAFGLVAPEETMKQPDSVRRAIRAAFDLMYDVRGVPHQN